MKPQDVKQRSIPYITVLNVVACFSVLVLHTSSFWSHPSGNYWLIANIKEATCYFAVPVFFMITGVTLIDYTLRESTKTFFIKRFYKTVIPFLAWGGYRSYTFMF